MGRLRGVDDFPVVVRKHLSLIVGQATLRVVQDQSRPKWCESCVNVDRIRIAREVDRMHPVIRKVTAKPFDTLQIRRETMLHHQIAAKPQHIRRVEQGLFFSRDKELLGGPLQPLFDADLLGQVVRMIIGIG